MSKPTNHHDSSAPCPANENQRQFYPLVRDAVLSGAKPMLGELARRYLCDGNQRCTKLLGAR